MLDIGWGELLIIGVVALIVVGPKELPGLFRTAGQFMGKARGMAREFQRSMEVAADESGVKDIAGSFKGVERLNLNTATKSARKYADGLVKGVDAAAAPKPSAPAAAAPTAAATPPPAAEAGAEPAAPARPGRAMKDAAKDEIDDTTAPLIEHLAELRTRLMYAILAFTVAMIAAFTVAGPIFDFLAAPIARLLVANGQEPQLIFTGLQQGFMTQVRISMFAGFLLAFPVIAYQLWRFVAPGLYRSEKSAFLPFLLASPILFAIGGSFAFYVVLPIAFDFFLSFQQFGANLTDEAALAAGAAPDSAVGIQFLGTINEYLGLTMKFVVAFGLCFQLPVLLTLMGKAGLVTAAGLVGFRRYAIVVILIVAAVATPPDVMSQLILFAAVYPLYEISIYLVRLTERKREAELRAAGLWDDELHGEQAAREDT